MEKAAYPSAWATRTPVGAGWKETPPMLKVVESGAGREAGEQLFELDEIARIGARRMLMAALKMEADDYVERHREERDETGRALVVHNGRSQGRKLTLGTGTVELRVPRVNDRRRDEHGQRQRFSSRILPPYMRRSPKVAEVLPILYLRGLSTGDFRPALEGLLGEDAAGLSPTNITRLTACWEKEYTAFGRRDLTARRSCSRSRTATGRAPRAGRRCCASSSGAGWPRRWWRWATARWGSGLRRARSGPRPASRPAGVTSSPTCSTSCPDGFSPAPNARSTR